MIIKKLNTVFHKHSKILFGAFTLIIIIAFMDFLTPGRGGCDGANSGSRKIGEVYGKGVTNNELVEFYNKYFAASQERDLNWQDLLFVYGLNVRADQLGIRVSDAEVAKAIGEIFADSNGKFDEKRYQEALKQRGINEEAFAEFIRMQIKMDKLQQYVASQIIVTPDEVAAAYRDANTVLHFKTASFSPESVGTPKQEELAKFFDDNKEKYRCIKLVRFPFGDGKLEEARKKANDFLREVRKSEAGKRAAAFDEVAKARKIKVRPKVWIAEGEDSGDLKAADLWKGVSSATERNPLTKVMVGKKAVYVGCLVVGAAGAEAAADAPMLKKHWRIVQAQKKAAEESERLNKIADRSARKKAFLKLKGVSFKDETRGLVAGIRDGDTFADGSSIYLLVKREPPKQEIPPEMEKIFSGMCRMQKIQLAWFAFNEEVRRNCRFMANNEGQN